MLQATLAIQTYFRADNSVLIDCIGTDLRLIRQAKHNGKAGSDSRTGRNDWVNLHAGPAAKLGRRTRQTILAKRRWTH